MNEDIDILKIEQEIRKKYTNRTDKEIIDLLFNSIPHITPFSLKNGTLNIKKNIIVPIRLNDI
jgi:hypothetical protein